MNASARLVLLAMIFLITSCNDHSPVAPQNPPEPKSGKQIAEEQAYLYKQVFLFDLRLDPSAAQPVTGDRRPIYVFSGRIKNTSTRDLSDVTVRVAIFQDGITLDQADVHILRNLPPGAVSGFSQEVRILPPHGKWNWAFSLMNAR